MPPRIAPGPSIAALVRRLVDIQRDPLTFLVHSADEHGDVVAFPVGRKPVVAVFNPDGVRHVLVDNHPNYGKATPQYAALGQLTGRGLLTSDGELWLRQRRRLQPAFHRRHHGRFVAEIVGATERMLARWERLADGSELDVDAEMLSLSLDIVGRSLFGADLSDTAADLVASMLLLLDDLLHRARAPWALPLSLPTPRNRQVRAARVELDQAVDQLLAARMAGLPRDDLLQRLLEDRAADGRAIGDRQVRDEVVTMLVAGHETVASALTWSWHLLARYPEARSALEVEVDSVLGRGQMGADDLARLPYTRAVLDESLRLFPPAWVISRRARGPDRLGGNPIPAGTLVILSPYVTQRRPELWPEPDVFRPERFLGADRSPASRYAYFPFGGGPRLCIGADFAILEGVLVLGMVAHRYRLSPRTGHQVIPEALVTLRPRGGLPMTLERRRPL